MLGEDKAEKLNKTSNEIITVKIKTLHHVVFLFANFCISDAAYHEFSVIVQGDIW